MENYFINCHTVFTFVNLLHTYGNLETNGGWSVGPNTDGDGNCSLYLGPLLRTLLIKIEKTFFSFELHNCFDGRNEIRLAL